MAQSQGPRPSSRPPIPDLPTDDQINAHVGARLRAMRRRDGTHIDPIAAYLGVSSQQAMKYEAGQTRLPPAKLLKLACFFGCPVDDFFRGLPGAEDITGDRIAMLRRLRGYIARWGLDHPEPRARDEAREALDLDRDDG